MHYHRRPLGEGSVPTMGDGGAPSGAKQHGLRPRMELAPNSVQKRAYRRAIRRALTHGWTWYRGQILTPNQVDPAHMQVTNLDPMDAPPPNHTKPHHPKGSRFTCFSWNVSGLALDKWDIFQQWVSQQDLDLIFLQETHWKHESQWQHPSYHCIHSGSSTSGGLLAMVSKKLCSFAQVTWNSIIPGRLQHLRISLGGRALDVIHCYQHVRKPGNEEHRDQVWQAVHDTLSTLPRRNLLAMTGDWNTNLTRASSVVGLGTYAWNGKRVTGPQAADESVFHNLLQMYDLVTLNTWDSTAGPTFQHDHGTSRIDYICTRRCHADSVAKSASVLPHMPLVPQNGPRHHPLIASLKKQWFAFKNTNPTGWTPQHRQQLRQHWSAGDQTWIHINEIIVQHLDSADRHTPPPLDLFHQELNAKVEPLVSRSSSKCRPEPNLNGFTEFLQCGQALLSYTTKDLATFFQCWKLVIRQQKARHLMRVHSKEKRKDQRRQLMQAARSAANANDQYTLFSHIRRITPKMPRTNIRLRGPHGQLLEPQEAAQVIADWLAVTYQDPHVTTVMKDHPDWIFDSQDLYDSFRSFESNKALAPDFLPSILWKISCRCICKHHS